MRKSLKIIPAVLFLLAACGAAYLFLALPRYRPAPNLVIERTPQRIERGRYLANNVTSCMDCHSQRDFSRFGGPISPGKEGGGGDRFDAAVGIPGVLYPPNITPAGLADWSDGEILRAITEGVGRDGHALFPIMPYPAFAQMSKEDLYSIIAYIRTLAPARNETGERRLDFPVNLIVRTIPRPVELPEDAPKPASGVAYGKHLASIASCIECHSQREKGELIPGMEFAGGSPFRFPSGAIVRSANITPDAETGIGKWSREAFIARFKKGKDTYPVGPGDFNSIMPWPMYAGMSDEDLGAIYDYLRTVKPVKNPVERFTGAPAPANIAARK